VVDGGGREWRRWRRDADGRRGRLHILQVSAHHSGARLVRLEDGDSSAMILPDGVWRRLLLLLDRADRQLVKLVPHPLGCTPPKHLLGQQHEREPEDAPDSPQEPTTEAVERKAVFHVAGTQVPEEASQLEDRQEGEASRQTHHHPGILQGNEGSFEDGQLYLLVPHHTLSSPQLVQTNIQLRIRPSGRGRQSGVRRNVSHDSNKEVNLKRNKRKLSNK
jgi:hypothetical protein